MIKKFGIYLGILIVCLSIGIKTAIDTPLGRNTVEIELTCSQTGSTEIFYDNGTGFSPDRRITASLEESEVKTKLIYELPDEQLIRVRWDPVYHEAGVLTTVHNIKMSYYGGEFEAHLTPESIVPQNHIKTFEVRNKGFEYEVETGSIDPYLIFTKIPEAPEKPSRFWVILKGIGFSLLATALLSVLYKLIAWYFNS